MILNYIKRLIGWRTERKDYADITFRIQKQILKKRRYDGEKQNKLYKNPPKFSRSIVRYINLDSKDNENVIFLNKKRI
jgi:hypothetical protein|tara:strand:+ start:356 stop:589 length:234 start_codon:yes stop_codon:yes gene_type:complete